MVHDCKSLSIFKKTIGGLISESELTALLSLPNDVDSINELSDINEINAKNSLQTLINIMKKYTTDIDISS